MPTQIITVLCEGPHDIAFICRLLKAIGFKSHERIKLGEYPSPINDFLKNQATKSNVEDLNFTQLRRTLLPSNALIKTNNIVFLYTLEGDGRKPARQEILRSLKGLIPDEGEILMGRLPSNISLSLVYFFDADDRGIERRINQINEEVKEEFSDIEGDVFESQGSIKTIARLKLGCFIFTGEDNDTGKLEDILIPLMRTENETIFGGAENYVDAHFDDNRLFPLKIKLLDGEFVESRSSSSKDKEKFDKNKSLIGTIGQLQRSGKSNVVCISDCDYITLSKIRNNPKCQEIINFFERFIGG